MRDDWRSMPDKMLARRAEVTTILDLRREAEAARTLLLNIRDVIGDDDQAASDAVEGETSLHDAASNALERLAEIDALTVAIKSQREKLSARLERLGSQADTIRAAIAAAMAQAGLQKMELPAGTISVKATAPSLRLIEEADIPAAFWKRGDPSLDKKAILAALKDKQDVPGACLSNGGSTIQIRWG